MQHIALFTLSFLYCAIPSSNYREFCFIFNWSSPKNDSVADYIIKSSDFIENPSINVNVDVSASVSVSVICVTM